MYKLLLLLCFAFCSASLVACNRRWRYQARPVSEVSFSPELVEDMQDFINLIPSLTIDELVAQHMLLDSDFRKAIKFLRSGAFKQIVRNLQLFPEVIEVINYVHLNDSQITRFRIHNRHKVLRLNAVNTRIDEAYFYDSTGGGNKGRFADNVQFVLSPLDENEDQMQPGFDSFISFSRELLQHLPRDHYVDLINDKRRTGTVFPKFYKAIRSAEFKQLVDVLLKSKNFASTKRALSSNAIDAEGMRDIAYEVISWGPAV